MKKRIGSYPRVRVEGGGRAVVSQAGGVLLVETARKTGLDQAISAALASWCKARAVHAPGKILLDVALAVALGGDCLADVGMLRAEPCSVRCGLRSHRLPPHQCPRHGRVKGPVGDPHRTGPCPRTRLEAGRTSGTGTTVTHRRSPARCELTGLHFCTSICCCEGSTPGPDHGTRRGVMATMMPTIDSAETSTRPFVMLPTPTARRSIVGGQGCGVLVRNGSPTESHRKVRLQSA